MQLPMTDPPQMGMTWVTPSPESRTAPVRPSFFYREPGSERIQLEYKDITAYTAICNPSTPNVSNIISAIVSRFSGGFMGGSVKTITDYSGSHRR